MKIYRVQFHTGNVGDSGIDVRWLSSKAEVRRFVRDELRPNAVEEFEYYDETWVLPKNLSDIVYHQGLNSAVDEVHDCGWAVEEVDVPTKSKIDMIDFLNLVADSE